MADAIEERSRTPLRKLWAQWSAALTSAGRGAGRPLLFGLRLWISVCLALYVAFYLKLDNEYWAGLSAAIICQPELGASLRKGWYRMIGTLVGAVAIVVLTALFPQARAPFLIGLALWGAACACVATLLRNFASYSAALAGYTAVIIASGELGAPSKSEAQGRGPLAGFYGRALLQLSRQFAVQLRAIDALFVEAVCRPPGPQLLAKLRRAAVG